MHASQELAELLESLRQAMKAKQESLVDELKAEAVVAVPTYGTWTYQVGGATHVFHIGPDKRGRIRVLQLKNTYPARGYVRSIPVHGMPLKEVANAMGLDLNGAEREMRLAGVPVSGYGPTRWVDRGRATRAFRKGLGLPESTVADSTLFTTRNTVRSADGTAENA